MTSPFPSPLGILDTRARAWRVFKTLDLGLKPWTAHVGSSCLNLQATCWLLKHAFPLSQSTPAPTKGPYYFAARKLVFLLSLAKEANI